VLQPLALSEPVAPMCAWALADLRVRHPQTVFNAQTYPNLFRLHFPALAGIPHSYDVSHDATGRPKPPTLPSRRRRHWGRALAAALVNGRLQHLAPRRTLARLTRDSLLRQPSEEKELMFLYKVQLFAGLLARSNVHLDWRALG